MKSILISSICLLVVINLATAQCNTSKKIVSPVSEKPTEAGIPSVTCNTLTLKWKGNANETYELNAVIKDAATNKIIQTTTTTDYEFDGLNYTASIPVIQGTKINWSVQAITVQDNRMFYSYPLRGKEYVVPNCEASSIADNTTKENSLSVVSEEKNLVKIYPNPFQSILNIEFNGTSALKKIINIYDVNGKLLLTKSTEGNTQIDVKQLTAGTYLIKINDESGKVLYNGKVIKQ
jgi:hypothetical protein